MRPWRSCLSHLTSWNWLSLSIAFFFCKKDLALTFLMRGLGFSKKLKIEVGFAFSNKGLKFQELWFEMTKNYMGASIMFIDFRFGLIIFTTHVTYICLKYCFTWKITLTELPLHNATSVIVIFYLERTSKAYVYQICCKYANTKIEIMKHYKKIPHTGDTESLDQCW